MNLSRDSNNTSKQNQQRYYELLILFNGLDVVSIAGNIIIAMLIYRDNKLKTFVGKLMVNQAVADGTVGVLGFVMGIYHLVFKPDQRSRFIAFTAARVCAIVLYSESFHTMTGTVLSLYVGICHPIKFRTYNHASIVAVYIASMWILNISIGCLIFATDNSIEHDNMMLFSFYRLQPDAIWYAALKIVVMFLPPLLSFIGFIKIWIYKRTIQNEEIQAQSTTNGLISQTQGIFIFLVVYSLSFILQIVNENIYPMSTESDTSNSGILALLVYLYLVLKLPLFLLAFKSYRKVTKNMFCPCLTRNRVQPLSTHERKDSPTTSSTMDKMLHPKWCPRQKEKRNTGEELISV